MQVKMENVLRFLHQRNCSGAFTVSFLVRSGFALLFLLERYFFSSQLDVLFFPSIGLIPVETAQKHPEMNPYMWTIFQAAPNSDRLLTIVYQIGIFHGILLLLGIFPRFQLVGILLNLVCFHHHNLMVWETSDILFRISCFFLLFLPVQKYGLTDWIFNRNAKTDPLQSSWPMWAFRLYQTQWTIIYLSTALGAWSFKSWKTGDAFFYIRNSDSWNPMFEQSDELFTSVSASRCFTWGAFFLFSTCWWLVWVPCFRVPVVSTMVCYHLFIETLTNTNYGNSLLALGWLTFLVKPDPSIRPAKPENQIAATFLVATILSVICIDSFPLELFTGYLPRLVQPAMDGLVHYQYQAYYQIEPLLCVVGIWQGIWDVSYVHEPHERNSFRASLLFADDGEYTWKSPDFASMTWLEKKQHGRVINYFASLSNPDAAPAALKLCDELRINYGSDMSSCELVHRTESDPLPPTAKAGTFAPSFEEMQRYSRSIVSVSYCVDQRDDCEELLDDNEDFCRERGMDDCANTCDDCTPLIEWSSSVKYEPEIAVDEDDFDDEGDEEEYYNDEPVTVSSVDELYEDETHVDEEEYDEDDLDDESEDDFDEDDFEDEDDYDDDYEDDDDEDDDEEDEEDDDDDDDVDYFEPVRSDGKQTETEDLPDERPAVRGFGNTALKA